MIESGKHNLGSQRETADLAKSFARQLQPGAVAAFYGELGSGKTFLIKQICTELVTIEEATSPSFTVINEYHTEQRGTVYHFDFYRLKNDSELANLGIDDLLYGGNICFVEWADKIQRFLPEQRYDVFIRFIDAKPEGREIEIQNRYL
jgi:tRNA threonylcarbamoyladenosine biosynthesis protein TsaE